MARTMRRQPFSVSTDSDDYTKSNLFTSVEFKGLCDSKNDVTVDSSTFAEVKNVYVDDAGQLTSRPPFKFYDGESHILQQWMFGVYGLRLQRHLSEDKSSFVFTIRCITHETVSDSDGHLAVISMTIPTDTIGFDFEPKVTCAQIEDKIFIWFAGMRLFALNLTGITDDEGNKYLYFEDAIKYLYFPIHKLVINGIESDFETKNFLTDTYRRRYQYSSLSSVNFEKLVGKTLDVSLTGALTQDTSKHLYNIEVQEHQDKMMLYPYSPVGGNYHIDIAQTSRATVVLRYSAIMHTTEVSFDGKYFKSLPSLDDIVGTPLLTKDGLYAVAFTAKGVAQCQLVAQKTDDFVEVKDFMWDVHPYMRYALKDGYPAFIEEIDTSFVPVAHFETIDQFAYIFIGSSIYDDATENMQYAYAEWLSGANDVMSAWQRFSMKSDSDTAYVPRFPNDDMRLHFRYVAPTVEYPTLAPTMIVATPVFYDYSEDRSTREEFSNLIVMFMFSLDEANVNRTLRYGDQMALLRTLDTSDKIFTKYVYSIDATGKELQPTITNIENGNMIIVTDKPHSDDDITIQMERVVIENMILPVTYEYDVTMSQRAYNMLYSPRFKIQSDLQPMALSRITLSPAITRITYSAEELEDAFGKITIANERKFLPGETTGTATGVDTSAWSWANLFAKKTFNLDDTSYTGNLVIIGTGNPGKIDAYAKEDIAITVTNKTTGRKYLGNTFGTAVKQIDLLAFVPSILTDRIEYRYLVAYNIICANENDVTDKRNYDVVLEILRDTKQNMSSDIKNLTRANSQWFKIMPNTSNVLTDNYLLIDGNLIMMPQDGELSPRIADTERVIANGNNLVLAAKDDTFSQSCDRNIHKLSDNLSSLASGQIESGDVVAYVADVLTEEDYLVDGVGYKFRIEKLSISDGDFVVTEGSMSVNELVRLESADDWIYPEAPDWNPGDDWPDTFPEYRPLKVNADGTIRFWRAGDDLPTGNVKIYGFVNLYKTVRPLSIDANGAWYLIDGTLWTSQLSTENTLELDEYINTYFENSKRQVHTLLTPPDYAVTLSEHYFAFSDKNYLLEVTETRRDADKLLSDEGTDLLLYLPRRNEQKFSNKITNLHPLSDTEIGIFTEKEVWYVSTVTNTDGTVFYTKPIKSKIPVGCRDGDNIITALDGQALIFPTPRGITALAPQDFIATTEKSLSYLSDNIQEKYRDFYTEGVISSARVPNEFEDTYDPQIKIATYRYWILFYKYYDREILAFDTRTAAWWIWSTPYPIRSIITGSRLHLLLQIDFAAAENSLIGVPFIFADKETNEIGYYDDTVDMALNGVSELIYENEFVGYRRKLQYASPTIDWFFVSQKLHFNQLNNYKAVRGITINVKGTEAFKAKLSTKAFRNVYHPEQSDTMEVTVNDLRTFVKRLNIMHVINFQYRLENDADTQQQLKLNSLSVKYEIKEGIR